MTSWKDDKNLGSWNFNEQANKFGYINNPRWVKETEQDEAHLPCGHWHKGPLTTQTTSEVSAIWQQSFAVSKTDSLLGVGAMDRDVEDSYILQITDLEGTIIKSASFDTPYSTSGVPGTTKINSVSGTQTVFYVNRTYDSSFSFQVYDLYKLDINGNSSKKQVYSDYYTDGNNFEYLNRIPGDGIMSVNSSGELIVVFEVYGKAAGISYQKLKTIRSDDWGVTFKSSVDILNTHLASDQFMDVDSDGNFYLVYNDYSDGTLKPFYLAKSSDSGASWNDIATVPTTPTFNVNDLYIDITGTKIYIAGLKTAGTDVNYLWHSIDFGANWTEETPTIAGEANIDHVSIAANGAVVILTGEGDTTDKNYIIRSTDSGATWNVIGQTKPTLTWPTYYQLFDQFPSLSNDGDLFVFASCGDYIISTDYLGFLKSVNDGVSWGAVELALTRETGTITSVVTYDEPQVWNLD